MSTDPVLLLIYSSVLDGMKHAGPRAINKRLSVEADDAGEPDAAEEGALRKHLADAPPDDPVLKRLRLALAEWDYSPSEADWTDGTAPNTEERRSAIYEALGWEPETRALLDEIAPFSTD